MIGKGKYHQELKGMEKQEDERFLFNWSRLVSFLTLFLIYSIILAYFGIFNVIFLCLGALIFFFLLKVPLAFVSLLGLIRRENILGIILFSFSVVWLGALFYFFSFSHLSGRDEGSYANAAILLAKEGKMQHHPEIFDILKNEGPARQSLNYPGFVINGDNLFSQFSPAYFVYLAIFYAIFGSVSFWGLANGLLVIAGCVAFFQIVRKIFPSWVAAAGVFVLLTHFVFLWFPRFTFSENLAFFILWNLILFLFFLRLEPGRKTYLIPIILLSVLFPLARPEGWWILAVTTILVVLWRKNVLRGFGRRSLLYLVPLLVVGTGVLAKLILLEGPVYKRLFKDWIKWKETGQHFGSLSSGGFKFDDLKEIIFSISPSYQKIIYFWKVEWNYGVLFFGAMAVLAFLVFILRRKMFSKIEKTLLWLLIFINLPFFTAFVFPQISSDHPFLLRRFMFSVLPCGVLLGVVLICKMTEKNRILFFLRPVLLAILIVPSLSASAYFLPIKTSAGRAEILKDLGAMFKKDDYVFMHRESSGDGWQMWSEPLWSIYGVNSAYVYEPDNVLKNKQFIVQGWQAGKKSYVILPNESYDFEHQLQKEFSLSLEKSIKFGNDELGLAKDLRTTSFPLLKRKEVVAKVYMLIPK